MYTQAGPQFRDELHRYNLPSSLVYVKQELISLLFCYNYLLTHTFKLMDLDH
jgi:hypothetical protein